MKKKNNLNEEVINEYFIYLLYMTNEKGHFKGEMLKNWRENELKTLKEMNDYWMININLDKLREDINITNIKSPNNISENNKNIEIGVLKTKKIYSFGIRRLRG